MAALRALGAMTAALRGMAAVLCGMASALRGMASALRGMASALRGMASAPVRGMNRRKERRGRSEGDRFFREISRGVDGKRRGVLVHGLARLDTKART
jgi:hypothetical protein